MIALLRSMLRFVILLVLIVGPTLATAHPAPSMPGQEPMPLSSLLQADGTLNTQAGFQGSIDPRGWAMVSDPGQPPRFVRASDSRKNLRAPDAVLPAAVPGDEFWDDRFDTLGISGYVRAMAVSGSDVYVGGLFSAVGGVAANNIAKWNSATGAWSALGGGVSSYVYAIAVSGSDVYVGGLFNAAGGVAANNIARWNSITGTWSALDGGVSSTVLSIAVSGSTVYVGGYFFAAGGTPSVPNTQGIARWNSTTGTWSALGTGVPGYVYAIAVSGSDVYAGGLFNAAGGVTASNVAKWNSTTNTWSALGSGVVNGAGYKVFAIAVSGSDVYVGGYFAAAGNLPGTQSIAKWNSVTNTWSALGSGVAGYVWAIAVSGSDVYVGGQFNAVAGFPSVPNTRNIAKWDGSSWSALGSGVSSYVYAIAMGADGVYVGGLFNAAGDKSSRNFGLWHGTVANPPNPYDVYWDSRFAIGLNNVPYALAVSGSDVYVGGLFTTAGGVSANHIAKWNGSSWSALGSGTNGTVSALAVSGSDLYVGGDFTTAGGVSANHIAKWNGSSWSALGSGTNGTVSALAVSGSDLYVGGNFSMAGGVSAICIAKWNGSSWSALGSGTNTTVSALAVSGSDVYVGGIFTMAGGVSVNRIARWNGSSWSALGSGVGSTVSDGVKVIAVSGSDVFVGGYFTMAGGVSANRIARWNGSSWSALSSGVTGFDVSGIGVGSDGVYVGGTFGSAGGVSAAGIAKWNGSSWSALGSGLNNNAGPIAISGSDVYVGGFFSVAGNKPSNYFGLWHAGGIAPPSGRISGRVTNANSSPLTGARVQACLISTSGVCAWLGTTDAQGNFTTAGLIDGQYRLTAYPPASSSSLPRTSGPLTIANGAQLSGQDLQLANVRPLPAGTQISPSRVGGGGLLRVNWNQPLQLTTQGCTGGSASYQIALGGATVRGSTLAESPAGQYHASIGALTPHYGYATGRLTIQCPGAAVQTTVITNDFDLYIEPAGIVQTVRGAPLVGATVTLFYYDVTTGSFSAIPNGDAIMAPVNRTNPDTTDATGNFGWDLTDGVYKIRAEKAGCVSATDPARSFVETDVMIIPPPVTDFELILDCDRYIYLPLMRR